MLQRVGRLVDKGGLVLIIRVAILYTVLQRLILYKLYKQTFTYVIVQLIGWVNIVAYHTFFIWRTWFIMEEDNDRYC